MKQFIVGVLFIAAAIGIACGGWFFERNFNFNFSYREQVRDEVRAMVKPECLKGGR
jgi:hypothetical protein